MIHSQGGTIDINLQYESIASSSKIALYDQTSIDALPQSNNEFAKKLRSFFLPIVKEGVDKCIANVTTKLILLTVDDLIIQLSNDKEYDNSYIVSNYSGLHILEELLQKKSKLLHKVSIPVLKMLSGVMKAVKINKVVIVNNWLLSGCIYPELSQQQIGAIIAFLSKQFPDHLITFRNVNTRQNSALIDSLKKEKCKLFKTRSIYIYDPAEKNKLTSKMKHHHRRDRKLIEEEGYEIVRNGEFTEKDFPHLIKLYYKVYIDKHSALSPRYTPEFLKAAQQSGLFDLTGLRKEGKIEAIKGCFIINNAMITPFFGFETANENSGRIYRMISILGLEMSESANAVLNDGSGSEGPKLYRGLKPFQEYLAVYANHLPLPRRLLWKLV